MKHLLVVTFTLAALVAGAGHVQAELYLGQPIGAGGGPVAGEDPIATLTYNDGTNIASAVLNLTVLGSGLELATSGALTVTAGGAIGTYPLIPGGPATFLSPEGAFLVNNVVYPASNPLLDTWGLLFGNGVTEINIWGNGPGNYSFWAYTPAAGYYVASSGQAAVTLSPEPSTIAIAALGGLGLVGYALRRRRSA